MIRSILTVATACAAAAGTTGTLVQPTNITIFHVNPHTYGAAPINMDIADINGDAFFDLRSVVQPLECRDPNGHYSPSDCTNPEVTAKDLVITKLVLEIDPYYGEYAFCNVCVNGSAGISGQCDKDGEYVCKCGHSPGPSPGSYGYECWAGHCWPSRHGSQNQSACASTCKKSENELVEKPAGVLAYERAMQQPGPSSSCNASVGRMNISSFFGARGCRQGSPAYECWRDNVAQKTGGTWYSTKGEGLCAQGQRPGIDNCTWRVAEVVKVVNKTCSDNSIYTAVEAYDSSSAGNNCYQQTRCPIGAHRNSTSDCWIDCFYKALLGPDSGKPGGAVAGLPIADLLAAWAKPFSSSVPADGGCAPLDYTMFKK